MSWQQIAIDIASNQADALGDALMERGVLSVSLEDALAGTAEEQPIFGEPGEPIDQLWTHSRLIALCAADADVAQLVHDAAVACGMAQPSYHVEHIAEQDWVRATQVQFDPIRISQRLWITPTWHESPDPSAINLALDPGLAFGTGSHPTTRLCLTWLDAHIKGGESVLDYGCGSGILAIAALKLGAACALGVDIDPQAIQASRDNATQNSVQAQFCLPNATPSAQYDIVLANILANPLRVLGELLQAYVHVGGVIVLSGILAEQAAEMSQLYQQWFDMEPPCFDDGWTRLVGMKR